LRFSGQLLMDDVDTFLTIEDLLQHPPVAKADFLELSVCDMVHFRLTRPDSIFKMVETRLLERNPERYTGFADCRLAVELSMRGATTKDKVDACCTRRPEWLDDRMILHATELEVWMDMSYPNPWGLKLYQAALMEGKYINIPPIGPFTETFHDLLKEKNGYELTEEPEPGYSSICVYVGEQGFLKESYLHLVTNYREFREHPMKDHDSLGAQLVYGVTEKDLEDHSAAETPEMEYFPHALGYRLLGPTILFFLQSLSDKITPVGISGKGSGLITGIADENRDLWPWLPEFTAEMNAGDFVSLFPQEPGVLPLFPRPGEPGILTFAKHPYASLIEPAISMLADAAFEGSDAALIQSGIRSFIRDFAQVSRGLLVPIPEEPIIEHWCHCVLEPMEGFLRWAGVSGHVPGFKIKSSPGALVHQLKAGPWPAGHLKAAGGFSKWWAGMFAGKRRREVLEAMRSIDE
jgi:hypothetical protein